jgi:hypothetical protein
MRRRFTPGIQNPRIRAEEVKTPAPNVMASRRAPVKPQIKRTVSGDHVNGSKINPYRWKVGKNHPFESTRYWKQKT